MLRHIFKQVKLQKLQTTPQPLRNYSLNTTNIKKGLCLNPNLKLSNKCVHTTKIANAKPLSSFENEYAFSVITKDSPSSTVKSPSNNVTTLEEFNATLDQNWRESSASEIVKAFASVRDYCIENNITIADTRFDKLVDGLMDHCEKLSQGELIHLLSSLSDYPPTDSYTSHNFHDIWSCLDDICCWRMIEWDIEKMITVANFWYKLGLGKISDYVFVFIDRLVKKADFLTKDQLVKVFFYFNVCRRRPVDFEYEYALEKQINKMNVDEMAVVAMGYFKTKTKIKLVPILLAMIERVTETSKSIHDISLTAILKILRYSKPTKLIPQLNAMLDSLEGEIDRVSDLTCLHIALIGTGTLSPHQRTLRKVSEKIVKHMADVEQIRLKDIERLLNVLTMLDFDPKTEPDIYKTALNELLREERLTEFIRYPRCLPCALHYLSLRNIYSHQLMDKVLDKEFINITYGKNAKNVPHVLLSLDASIDIECPDYKGNRLLPDIRYKAAKWLTEYTPSYDQHKKISAADQFILDTIDTAKAIVKDEKLIYIDHILPHFWRADIILCKNKHTGDFVEPVGFENYILGDVMFPMNDDRLKWFAIVILGWNSTIRETSIPLGLMVMKERQLAKMGYTPVFVIWNEFLRLSKEERVDYISRKLS